MKVSDQVGGLKQIQRETVRNQLVLIIVFFKCPSNFLNQSPHRTGLRRQTTLSRNENTPLATAQSLMIGVPSI